MSAESKPAGGDVPKPRKKKRRRLSSRLLSSRVVQVPVELFLGATRLMLVTLGPGFSYWFARRVASLLWLFLPRLRGVTRRNLDLCLPELPLKERNRIARASFSHAVYTFADILLMPRFFAGERWRDYVELAPEIPEYVDWLKNGQASVTLTGHFGNWEAGLLATSRHGVSFGVVARPVQPPLLNRWILKMREFAAARVIEKAGAAREMTRILRREKGAIAMLVDQNGGDFAPIAPFFGIPARWQADIAKLSIHSGGRLATIFCIRQGERFRFKLVKTGLFSFDKGTEPMEFMAVYGRELEEMIRKHPEQYFWMHRRFKGRPEGAKDRYSDLDRRLTAAERAELLQ